MAWEVADAPPMDLGRWQPTCELPEGLVVPVGIDPTGRAGPTHRRAYGPHFRQTSPGRFVPAEVGDSVVEQRILEQSGRLRAYGAVTAWAALRWRGAAFFSGLDCRGQELPVPLVLGGAHLRVDHRVLLTKEQLAPHEFETVAGIRCTTACRALFDEVRLRAAWSLREAVVAIDMAIAAGLVTLVEFLVYVTRRTSWTGVPAVRAALLLASGGSLSPQESRMRLVWVLDALFPPPICNWELHDKAGRLIGIPDLLDPVAGVVGEYQGADHRRPDRHRRDVARADRFRDHGLEYFEVVEGDLRARGLVVDRMRRARSRARFLSPDECTWIVTSPKRRWAS